MSTMTAALHAPALVLAKIEWNVTMRGLLFPLIMFIILCGSSYMILSTNIGNRLGFLIAVTGLVGWMFLMSIAWMLYGIGLKGRAPAWRVTEVITGQPGLQYAQQSSMAVLSNVKFQESWCSTDAKVLALNKELTAELVAEKAAKSPKLDPKKITLTKAEAAAIDDKATSTIDAESKKARDAYQKKSDWEPLCDGRGQRGDGESTVAATLIKNKEDPLLTPRAVFADPTEYKVVGAYRRGGENYFLRIGNHRFFLRHSPHYFVIMVRPVQLETVQQPVLTTGRQPKLDDKGKPEFLPVTGPKKGPDKKPLLDTTKPITSVVMLRDQGSKRLPPFVLFMFSGIALAILASVLHARDKQVMAAMGKPYKRAKDLTKKG